MRPSMADGEHMQRFARGVVVVCGLGDLSYKGRPIFVLGQVCFLCLLRSIDVIPTDFLVICGLDTIGARPNGSVALLLNEEGVAVEKEEDVVAVLRTVESGKRAWTIQGLEGGVENAGVVSFLFREEELKFSL